MTLYKVTRPVDVIEDIGRNATKSRATLRFNALRLRTTGRHNADDIMKLLFFIFLNEKQFSYTFPEVMLTICQYWLR